MPKQYTFPTLYDDALQINITRLKELDFLKPEQIKQGSLTWKRNGHRAGEISIKVSTDKEHPYIELNYKYNDEPRKYEVSLVSMPSNLGKGLIWYFLCPRTNKRCRILYFVRGYFLHREAFNGCMYNTQTKSKSYRLMESSLGAYFETDNLYDQLYQKHFKKTYAGKPTKKYLKILKQLTKARSITSQDLNSFLLK